MNGRTGGGRWPVGYRTLLFVAGFLLVIAVLVGIQFLGGR
jgi:hypothetical protein